MGNSNWGLDGGGFYPFATPQAATPSMKDQLKIILEDTTTRGGRAFDLAIQGLIVFSLVSLTVETLPDLPTSTFKFFQVSELIVVAVFSAEYLLRLWVADRPLKFAFSTWGLISESRRPNSPCPPAYSLRLSPGRPTAIPPRDK
ncbi:MAG: hypothetical protein ACI80V_000937 [Rhodothermales bacterium]|jgi:hypothetical protein